MFQWIEKRAKLLLLVAVLAVLILIMAQIAMHAGLMRDTRTPAVDMTTTGSGDSPLTVQYFFVTEVSPGDISIEWKDVRVMTKAPCTDAHLDKTKDPPVYNCPKYQTMTEGTDYKVVDRDMDDMVSEEDTVQFYMTPSGAWGKDIAFKWRETGDILHKERLPGP